MIVEGEDDIILEPGKYHFHADGITIEEIGGADMDDMEDYVEEL